MLAAFTLALLVAPAAAERAIDVASISAWQYLLDAFLASRRAGCTGEPDLALARVARRATARPPHGFAHVAAALLWWLLILVAVGRTRVCNFCACLLQHVLGMLLLLFDIQLLWLGSVGGLACWP